LKNSTKLLGLSIFLLSKPLLAIQAMGYMGLQLGIAQIQDKLELQDSISNIPNPISVSQHHNGIQTGSNFGVMVGGMLHNQKYSLGAELRLSHLEYNQTRELYTQQANIAQNYGATQTTKINNFSSLLGKFGAFIISDAMLYGQLGLGVISTKVDYIQNLSAPIGYQATQDSHSKKNAGVIIGAGLEVLMSPHLSIYYDFNYTYFPSFQTNAVQTINNITSNYNESLQQQLFQAVLGIKWHTRKTPKHIDAGLSGWYIGANLGLLQTNINTDIKNLTLQNTNFITKSRFSIISPDIDIVLGKSWVGSKLAIFLEGTASIHPIEKNKNISVTYNGTTLHESSVKNAATLAILAKPGFVFYNRMLYFIAGIGTTHLDISNQTSWSMIYMTGWGIETPLSEKLNLKAEYIFAFSNHADHNSYNDLHYTNEKLVQQKGTIGLAYYFC